MQKIGFLGHVISQQQKIEDYGNDLFERPKGCGRVFGLTTRFIRKNNGTITHFYIHLTQTIRIK